MNLYRTTKGTWLGTKADWKKAETAEGGDGSVDPVAIDVPINPKSALIDFLNGLGTTTPAEPRVINAEGQTLDEMFDAAPPKVKLELAVRAIDTVDAAMTRLVAAYNALRAQQN